MNTKAVLGLVILFTCCLSIESVGWNKVSTHVGTFLFGVSFVDGNNGWVSGFSLGDPFLSGTGGPIVLATTSAGLNWTKDLHTSAEESYVFMSISMVDKQHGIVAGTGLPPSTGIATTTDGTNWTSPYIPGEYFEEAYLDVGGIYSNNDYFYYAVGEWSKYKEVLGEGIQISTPSNTTNSSSLVFTPKPWSGLPSVYGARYGSFISDTQGWITAGNLAPVFPNPSPSRIQLSETYYLDLIEKKLKKEGEGRQTIFEGAILSTTDAGTTYQVVLNTTSDLGINAYFNGISFVDANNGWAVAVGTNSDNHTTSFVVNTSNGGASWSIQFEADKVHLFRIRMIDTKNGWAVGFKFPDLTLFSGALYHTTDGGKNWRDESIHDVIPFDIAVINSTTAYTVGFGLDFSSNFYAYSSIL